MRKTLILAFLALIFCTVAVAQGKEGHRERIKAYKTAYITQELNLTSEEAEKFWPIYNEYDSKIFNLRIVEIRKEKHRIRDLGGPENMNSEDAKKTLAKMLAYEKEAGQTKEKMYQELSNILDPVKLMKLYEAEMNFGKKLLSDFRKRRPEDQN